MIDQLVILSVYYHSNQLACCSLGTFFVCLTSLWTYPQNCCQVRRKYQESSLCQSTYIKQAGQPSRIPSQSTELLGKANHFCPYTFISCVKDSARKKEFITDDSNILFSSRDKKRKKSTWSKNTSHASQLGALHGHL